ncbi:MAG: HAMP domain-containing histidine kinase, partial [Candidatus Aminicenantes bacterium]|nr:HAMP domain-containing histidine kinase [Candidatus Aminicenantes bacterium]
MLNNLKLVLSQNKKVLAIFFIVVFLPSIFLAFFGMRALRNEKFKLQQQTLEEQKGFVGTIQREIQDSIEKISSNLIDLVKSEAFSKADYSEITKDIKERLRNDLIFGEVIIWNKEGEHWLPAYQPLPPTEDPLIVPEEWIKIQPDLIAAEMTEFRQKDFSNAIIQYQRIENKVNSRQVKAWILNRIARCELKRNKKENALDVYHSLLDLYSDLLTESGRSLEFASRIELLNILQLSGNYKGLFKELVNTYRRLEEKSWSLDESQVRLYANTLKKLINEMASEDSEQDIPVDFLATIADFDQRLEEKLEIWNLVESADQSVLSGSGVGSLNSNNPQFQIQKSVFEHESQDVFLFLTPVNEKNPDSPIQFLGSLLRKEDLLADSEVLSAVNFPKGFSVLLRSNQTDRIVFGKENIEGERPIFTDLFLNNFPPWRVELYKIEGLGSGFVLYKNIFFWMIITLLLILFFGSGLIIRLLSQEMNLLQLKSEFIASVSHEFKTPLTSMGAILEHLQDGKIKDQNKIREYYRILKHDSDRLKRLVLNVLDFTKIEEGKRTYRPVSIDIGKLVRQEVDSFEKEHKLSGFTVNLQMENNSFPVYAD